MTELVIQYDQWVDTYSPMFADAEGSELVQYPTWDSLPAGQDIDHVWAVIEGDDPDCTECKPDDPHCDHDIEAGPWVIMPGYHLVNVVYFVITRNPWANTDSPTYVNWD